MASKRLFETPYGYFTADGREYVITRPDTPKPWVNVICPDRYGTIVTQAGTGYSWSTHATFNRITRWEQDLVRDEWGKHLYCRERGARRAWSLTWQLRCRCDHRYECRHGVSHHDHLDAWDRGSFTVCAADGASRSGAVVGTLTRRARSSI